MNQKKGGNLLFFASFLVKYLVKNTLVFEVNLVQILE